MLGFLASKVLGQFDPFHEPDGRLLLVAPNIVHVERELEADPHDFRLWVCLHEETHRVQFTAVPWMREHMFGQIQKFAETMEPSGLLEDGLTRVLEGLKNARAGGSSGGSLLDVVGTPEQKELLDGLTGVMSLLEGHADVVMDGVGPTVIPSVAKIRAKFNERRKGVGVLDRLLRRVLGLDAKMAQYRDGAAFVRAVVDKAGMSGFNVVWEQPEHLPTRAEIADPDAWMARVLRTPEPRHVEPPPVRRRRSAVAVRRTLAALVAEQPGRGCRRTPPCWSRAPAARTRWRCSRRRSSRGTSSACG